MERLFSGNISAQVWLLTIFGLSASCALGVAKLFLWRDKHEDAKRRRIGSRTPVSEKLQRPPGHSLMRRIDDAFTRFALSFMMAALVAGAAAFCGANLALLGWAYYRQLSGTPVTSREIPVAAVLIYAVGAIGFVVATVVGWKRARTALMDIRTARLGLRGEQAVAEALNLPSLVKADYRSFHDLQGDGSWNIDHVVVGPGGIYVVETKARSKPIGPSGKVIDQLSYDATHIRFPDWDDYETFKQARRNVDWVRRFLEDFCPAGIEIVPVVVVPGWKVHVVGEFPVKVMSGRMFVHYLLRRPKRFGPAELRSVVGRLKQHCKALEF